MEVADPGRGFDPASVTGPREIGGYGLFLVKRIASRWGVDPTDGVNVWFELDRPYELVRVAARPATAPGR